MNKEELIKIVKLKIPNLINTTDLEEISASFIDKTIKVINNEISKIFEESYKKQNKSFWIIENQEITRVMEMQEIVRIIGKYVLDTNNGNKETKLYKEVKELNAKCTRLLNTIDPL